MPDPTTLHISDTVAINCNEIEFTQIHSSGPGGQNVNKVANGICLRFDVKGSSLSEHAKRKIMAVSDRRIGKDGGIIIKAQRFRSTEKNREDAIERLRQLVAKALRRVPERIPTRPTAASKRKRLDLKQQQSSRKTFRRRVTSDD